MVPLPIAGMHLKTRDCNDFLFVGATKIATHTSWHANLLKCGPRHLLVGECICTKTAMIAQKIKSQYIAIFVHFKLYLNSYGPRARTVGLC